MNLQRSAVRRLLLALGLFLGAEVVLSAEIRVLVYSVEPFFVRSEPSGLEYELLTAFAEEHDHELVFVYVDHFQGILDRLEQGEGRIVASTVTITESRRKKFDFSEPYFPVLSLLVQRRGTEVERLEDLAGRRALVVGGSLSAKKLAEVDGLELLVDTEADRLFLRASAGEADAFGTDSSNYVWRAERFPDFVPTLPLSERSYFGFVLGKGDPLKKQLDATLRRLKESGEFRELLLKVFGDFGVQTIDEMSQDLSEP